MIALHAKKLSIIAVALAGLLLAGCINVQSNMALYGNDQWSGVQAVQLSAEIAELMEQGGASATTQDGVTQTTSMETDDIEKWLANAQQLSGGENLNVAFNESTGADGSKNYVLQASGRGLALLNEAFFQGEADISAANVNGQRQVTIKYEAANPSGEMGESSKEMTAEEQAMQEQMIKAFGLGMTFRISGGEIINSNATRVEGNTAIWENADTIEVTLTEAAELSANDIALVDPPADSGFSSSALESLMEDLASEMDAASMQAAEGSDETATQDNTATQSEEPTETAEQEATTTEGETVAGANTTDNSDAAATPAEEDSALPNSGAVLPGQESLVPFVLAGLVLVVLAGGATVRVCQRN